MSSFILTPDWAIQPNDQPDLIGHHSAKNSNLVKKRQGQCNLYKSTVGKAEAFVLYLLCAGVF